jgi:hypothetical protein
MNAQENIMLERAQESIDHRRDQVRMAVMVDTRPLGFRIYPKTAFNLKLETAQYIMRIYYK